MENELKQMVGKVTSVNQSPTLRAKLIEVRETRCVWEVAPGEYDKSQDEYVGFKFTLPIYISENCFFGV
jgi:hypothetical protein